MPHSPGPVCSELSCPQRIWAVRLYDRKTNQPFTLLDFSEPPFSADLHSTGFGRVGDGGVPVSWPVVDQARLFAAEPTVVSVASIDVLLPYRGYVVSVDGGSGGAWTGPHWPVVEDESASAAWWLWVRRLAGSAGEGGNRLSAAAAKEETERLVATLRDNSQFARMWGDDPRSHPVPSAWGAVHLATLFSADSEHRLRFVASLCDIHSWYLDNDIQITAGRDALNVVIQALLLIEPVARSSSASSSLSSSSSAAAAAAPDDDEMSCSDAPDRGGAAPAAEWTTSTQMEWPVARDATARIAALVQGEAAMVKFAPPPPQGQQPALDRPVTDTEGTESWFVRARGSPIFDRPTGHSHRSLTHIATAAGQELSEDDGVEATTELKHPAEKKQRSAAQKVADERRRSLMRERKRDSKGRVRTAAGECDGLPSHTHTLSLSLTAFYSTPLNVEQLDAESDADEAELNVGAGAKRVTTGGLTGGRAAEPLRTPVLSPQQLLLTPTSASVSCEVAELRRLLSIAVEKLKSQHLLMQMLWHAANANGAKFPEPQMPDDIEALSRAAAGKQ